MDLSWIKTQVTSGDYEITPHADQEMQDEDISVADLETALLNGEILEQYADRGDPRGDSCLVLGRGVPGNPIHIVVSSGRSGEMHIVTTYIPRPPKWIDERTRRRK